MEMAPGVAAHPNSPNWPKIFGGPLKEIQTRVTPSQGEYLDQLRGDDEAIARAVTKSWAHDAYPQMSPDDIDNNWDTVRPQIAKNAFGVDDQHMDNRAFYGLVSKHLQDETGFRATLPEQLAHMPTAIAKNMKDWFVKPAVELPEAPKDAPDIPAMGLNNPALWAGVYNGAVRPFVNFTESPEGLSFLAGGAELKALSEVHPVAKAVLGGISGLFGYMMGSETIKTAPEVKSIFSDPKATLQQKVEVVAKEISNASLTLLATFGMVEELGGAKDLENQLKGKTPPQAVDEVRVQALTAKEPKAAAALHDAADTLETYSGLRTPGQPPANSGTGLGWFEEGDTVQRAPGSTSLELPHSEPVEQITAAAVKLPDGTVAEGPNHATVRDQTGEPTKGDEGFVTSTGRFVSREEGQKIAEASGQVPPVDEKVPGVGNVAKELHSEDLPPAKETQIAKPEPTEAQDPVKETSLKNAVADLERKGYGMEEATPSEKRAMADSWVRSGTALERDASAGVRLADELKKNPNLGLTDDQSALLLRHKVALTNSLNEVIDIANDENQSPELRNEAQRQATALSNELQDFMEAVHKRGSEWGREGRWRQAMAKEDYTFAAQERLLRVAKGGAELSPEERETLTKQITAIKTKNAELQAAMDSLRAQISPEQAADRAVRELAKPPTKPRAPSVANRIRDGLRERALQARRELSGKVLSPVPKDVYNMSVIAADWVVQNGIDAAKWSSEMIKEFGDRVRPILEDAWKAGVKLFHTETRAALVENYRAKGSPDIKPDVGPLAQELARSFISQGLKGRDELVDAVHDQLKSVDPSITRRDAMDAISGYGKFKQLTHDEITDRLRDLKGQLQQVAKLEDMEAGQAPAKTGVERRAPSDEERALQKQVAEKKKEGGYEVTDRATQLRTALDAVKTRLRNSITDLEKQIAAREKIVKKKTGLVYDQEAESLRARRDELQEQFDEVFKEDDTAERNERQRKSVQKQIDDLQKKLDEGDTRPEGLKVNRPAPPHLEPLKQELDRLRDEMADLRGKAEQPLEVRLNKWKARSQAKVEELEQKLRDGDIFPPAKKPPVALDKEGLRIQGQLERLKDDLAIAREKAKEAAKPKWQKRLNTGAEIAREAAISGYHILGKIVAYTAWKIPEFVATESTGAIIKRMPGFAKIRAKANLELGEEKDTLAKFFTAMATDGMRDAKQVLTTGRSDLKIEVGNKKLNARPIKWWHFSGISHMVEKSLLFRGDFEVRLTKATAAAQRAGLDTKDGMVQAGLRQEAGNYADRAILQEQNKFAEIVNEGFRRLDAEDPETKQVDKDRAVISFALKTFVTKGIVKTPANYIWQSFARTPLSLLRGTGGLIKANLQGVDKLSPKEANTIARCFKVGLVGTGMFIWGAIDATKDPKDRIFGGYYQPGDKRSPDDVEFARMRVDGHQLWHIATHSPITEPAQMGSTMMRVLMSHKRGKEDKGVMEAAMASILALASMAPIANPITQVSKDVEQGHGDQILWDEIANLVPGLVANIAEDVDKGTKRKATGPVDTIKAKIPILRSELPEAKKKGPGVRTADTFQ